MAPCNVIASTETTSIASRAIVLLLIAYRPFKKKSLTNLGIAVGLTIGFIHSLPPSNLYLILLITLYLNLSKAIKYRREIKEKRTKSPTEEIAPQHSLMQVLCNFIISTVLILISLPITDREVQSLIKAGVIGQYAAIQADAWSSELGIISASTPFLITNFQKVPPGTNGGVTKVGLFSGLVGSSLISAIAALTYPNNPIGHFVYFTIIGFIGTIIDSVLGALFQYSIIDERGMVLEAPDGKKIDNQYLFDHKDSLKKVSGEDVFSNNQVNVIMAGITTLLSIGFYQMFF